MDLTSRRAADKNLMNAIAARAGRPATWIVRGCYSAGDTGRVMFSRLTYREACAIAKGLRAGGAYAQAERA